MTHGFTTYARVIAARSLASAVALALSACVFLVLSAAAATQQGELAALTSELSHMEPASCASQERLAELERELERKRATGLFRDESSRYRFASQMKARLVRSGVTVLNVLPARGTVVSESAAGGVTAFRFEIVSPPSGLLAFLRSVHYDPEEVTISSLRLRVDGNSLRGDLTIGYRDYDSEEP